MPCRPRRSVRTATHAQPRERVRKNADLRLCPTARTPERQQLLAVGFPVGAHLVSDERREIGADAVAVPGVALLPGYTIRPVSNS
jgi:hypothetical protein